MEDIYAKLASSNSSDELLLRGILEKRLAIVCTFCSGYGHVKKQCESLKKMNDLADKTGLRPIWGTMKGQVMSEEILEATKEKLVRTQSSKKKKIEKNIEKAKKKQEMLKKMEISSFKHSYFFLNN